MNLWYLRNGMVVDRQHAETSGYADILIPLNRKQRRAAKANKITSLYPNLLESLVRGRRDAQK